MMRRKPITMNGWLALTVLLALFSAAPNLRPKRKRATHALRKPSRS